MSVPHWFIFTLSVIVAFMLVWKFVLQKGVTRFCNYFFLYYVLSKVRQFDSQEVRIKCASRLIQYDFVVRLLVVARKNPILMTKEINLSQKLLNQLRHKDYNDVTILRAAVEELRQYSDLGFDSLPAQTVDEDTLAINKIITTKLSTKIDYSPAVVLFFIVLGNRNLTQYLK
jgi:hypothetical protein